MGDYHTERTLTEQETPTVSVVIPLYNKAPHISRAIDSVLAQTVQDFEIVVVDDGSTDNGADIVSSFTDPRIRLIRQENQGVSAARNRGIVETRSDLIAFLDADDEWGNDHLEVLLRLRRNFPEAGAYSTAYIHVYPDGKIVPAKIRKIPPAPWEGLFTDYFLSASFGEPPVCSSAVAIPRAVFYKVGFFKVGEKMGEDLDMWGRIALNYPIAFSWQGLAFYREDATERACVTNHIEQELPFVRFVREHFTSKEIPPSVRIYICELQNHLIHSLINRGQKKEALKKLLSLGFFNCRKYTFFHCLFWIILPEQMAKLIGFLKRRLLMVLRYLVWVTA